MTQALLTSTSPGQFILSGVLNFYTVPSIKEQSHALFENTDVISVDLTDISYSDSSGLALLADWTRYAKKNNKPISYINIPQQMQAIAEVTGLVDILPLEN